MKYQSLYYPTNAHKVNKVKLLKHIQIMEVAPTFLWFTKKPSSRSHSQCLAKVTVWFSVDIDVVQSLSVLWRHSMTCVACVLYTVQAYMLAQCTTQVILCRHSTDNVCTTSISILDQSCNFNKALAVAP